MDKEIIAMLLAGGQGSRLGVLTDHIAKPAVEFGGKYRIIDFPLSNCINSKIDTVGVLTQYQPLVLNTHIGIGIPWDLDRIYGGVTVLPPYERSDQTEWYTGTANAVYQNLNYIEGYSPGYVAILSGDHIYKMDYGKMLDYHKEKGADVTIATMPVSMDEASRFGIMVTDSNGRVIEFQEKPDQPKSNLASMGIYIFSWKALKESLTILKEQSNCDFGKHVIPYCHEHGMNVFGFRFEGYWKDVGTLESYWQANMELIELIPIFNLYEEYWRTYTNTQNYEPHFLGENASSVESLISEGAEILGKVERSIIGPGVFVGANTIIRDSIIMRDCKIGSNVEIIKSILGEKCRIGNDSKIGVGEEAKSLLNPEIYTDGIAVIGCGATVPRKVTIGKNTVISGETMFGDYEKGNLPSGGFLLKEGEVQ